jgi:hypothetical protein
MRAIKVESMEDLSILHIFISSTLLHPRKESTRNNLSAAIE